MPELPDPGPGLSRRRLLALGGAGLALPLLGGLSSCTPSSADAPRVQARNDADDVLDLRDFGAQGDGQHDDTTAVQEFIDATARRGTVGVVPPGTYRCTAGLLVPQGAQFHLERGALLLKDWAAPAGLREAFLRNRDFAVKSDGVRITGPGTIGARDHARTGVVLGLYGDDMRLSDFTIDTYAGGQAVLFAGDRGRMDRVTIRNSAVDTGTGGIRVIGGKDFLATGCHVESGDDCLQFVPIGNPDGLLYDLSISGGAYVGCTGTSTTSRFMVALLEYTGGEPGSTDMAGSVTDCSFRDCHGAGSNRGIVVKNSHSSGTIAGVSFTDCSVDMSGVVDAGAQEIRIQTDAPAGGSIRDISFTRTSVLRPVNSTLRIGGPNISGVTFDDCDFTAPSGAAPLILVADQVDRLRVRRCSFTGAPGKRMIVVGPVSAVTGLSVEESRFTDVPDGVWAVDLTRAPGARMQESVFRAAGGATDARAIRVQPESTRVVIEDNDFTGITNPAPITDRAAGTTIRRNRGG